jgi:hypothetical protein
MNPIRPLSLALLLVTLTTTFAVAHPVTPRVDRRQARQSHRIACGVESGRLTRQEVRSLRAGQRRVARLERRAKADGVVTPRERARIARAQRHQSRRIALEMRDRQTR